VADPTTGVVAIARNGRERRSHDGRLCKGQPTRIGYFHPFYWATARAQRRTYRWLTVANLRAIHYVRKERQSYVDMASALLDSRQRD